MKTLLKKILPIASLLVLALALTGCDAILEGFYPEYKEGGANSARGIDVELTVDKGVSGNIIIALVPYEKFNGEPSANRDYIEFKATTVAASTKAKQVSANFRVDPNTQYRVLGFIEKTAGTNKPSGDLKGAILLKVTTGTKQIDLFFGRDVMGLLKGGPLTAQSQVMDSSLYGQIFAENSFDGHAFILEGPAEVRASDLINTANYALVRAQLSKAFDQVSKVQWSLERDGSYASSGTMSAGGGGFGGFEKSISLNNLYTFTASGQYDLSVKYWLTTDIDQFTAIDSQTLVKTILVGDLYTIDVNMDASSLYSDYNLSTAYGLYFDVRDEFDNPKYTDYTGIPYNATTGRVVGQVGGGFTFAVGNSDSVKVYGADKDTLGWTFLGTAYVSVVAGKYELTGPLY